MGITLCRIDRGVTEQFLHVVNAEPNVHEGGGEAAFRSRSKSHGGTYPVPFHRLETIAEIPPKNSFRAALEISVLTERQQEKTQNKPCVNIRATPHKSLARTKSNQICYQRRHWKR
jgi:hypothetical protein